MTEPTEPKTPSKAVEPFVDPGKRATAIELAVPAWGLAQKLANTEFVPKAMQGKPEAVLACILYGREAGVGEMAALSKIHVVNGKPGMAAELMRALVLQHGHEIWIEETSSTKAIVAGTRRNSERVTRIEWTMDDAKRAKLDGKDVWRQYPADMLVARATARLCRLVFADVLSGLSYTPEELEDGIPEMMIGDGDLVEHGSGEPAAPARPRARARKSATRGSAAPAKTEPDPTPKADREEPELPGEDDDGIVEAELVDDAESADSMARTESDEPDVVDAEIVEDEAPSTEEDGPRYRSPAQAIAIRLREEHKVTDDAHRYAVLSSFVGREISSGTELTKEETTSFFDFLQEIGPDARFTPDGEVTFEQAPPAEPVPAPEPRRRRTSAPSPETWDADGWRAFLGSRKVKVTEVLREAQRHAAEEKLDPPASLDEIAGSGMAEHLVGFVEDLALERSSDG